MIEIFEAINKFRAEKKRLLIDLNSIARATHAAGKDVEFGREVTTADGSTEWVNSGRYCFELFMVSYINTVRMLGLEPYQTILVLDGERSRQFRQLLYAGYKAKRPTKSPEYWTEYNKGVAMICDAIVAVGGTVMAQDGMEADDVLAYLSTHLEGRKTIWSRDGDMLALKSESCDVYLKDTMNPDIHADTPAPYVLLYKSLVGDTSDNLPGARGFGKKAFVDLVINYGYDGLDMLQALIVARNLQQLEIDGDTRDFKPLARVVEGAQGVYDSFACAQFYPERINTPSNPIKIRTGRVELPTSETHPEFATHWAATHTLLTADNFPSLAPKVIQLLQQSPFVSLDIETSPTDEGEAWCEAIDAIKTGNKSNTVDVYGAVLTGMSLTFGRNLQHTVYMSVDHADTNNLTVGQVKSIIDSIPEKLKVIQNTGFELVVLYNTWGEFLPNVIDTQDMKSYVNENTPLGLKPNSLEYLGYQQVSYEEVTTLEGPPGTLPEIGKYLGTFTKLVSPAVTERQWFTDPATGEQYAEDVVLNQEVTATWERRRCRMNELPATHVAAYGFDDTICTAALFNRYELTLEMEGSYEALYQIELPANYWVAQAYIDGVDLDSDLLKQLETEDASAYAKAWEQLRGHLFRLGWEGTYYTPYELTPANIKEIFKAITGETLDCRARLFPKIAQACREQGLPEIAECVENEDVDAFNEFIQGYWEPEPEFDLNKKAHLRKLMYEVMGLPIRFRTPVTQTQRDKGVAWGQGTPQCDFFAIEHALKLDLQEDSPNYEILTLIRKLNQINTRGKLYYRPYPLYAHWKDGKIHASIGKNKTATRRFAPNGPNLNQLPKKGDGIKVRGCIKGYKKNGVWYLVCAMDFSGQELRLAAEESGDVVLTSCYVGDDLRDPHSLTGAGIAVKAGSPYGDYQLFIKNLDEPEVKEFRNKGKGTNFSSQYLCQAPKLAKLLVVPVEEGQLFLDAKASVYTGLTQWQSDTIQEAHAQGYVTTRLGVRRHLYEKLASVEGWKRGEAERQSVNFKIQGSAAEMTKLAINTVFMQGLREQHGTVILFPVHDELVTLVRADRLYEGIPALHACMVQNYAGMTIPLESEIKIGFDFGKGMVKIGTNPSKENIEKALLALGFNSTGTEFLGAPGHFLVVDDDTDSEFDMEELLETEA